MGPSVKFVLAIVDAIFKKKIRVNFLFVKNTKPGGGARGGFSRSLNFLRIFFCATFPYHEKVLSYHYYPPGFEQAWTPILYLTAPLCKLLTGWQMLCERASSAHRKVRIFYERKEPQHTLFCRETLSQFTRSLKGFHRAFNESHPAFIEFSTKAILLS